MSETILRFSMTSVDVENRLKEAYVLVREHIGYSCRTNETPVRHSRATPEIWKIRARLVHAVHLVQGEESVVRRGIKTLCNTFDVVGTMTQDTVSL